MVTKCSSNENANDKDGICSHLFENQCPQVSRPYMDNKYEILKLFKCKYNKIFHKTNVTHFSVGLELFYKIKCRRSKFVPRFTFYYMLIHDMSKRHMTRIEKIL